MLNNNLLSFSQSFQAILGQYINRVTIHQIIDGGKRFFLVDSVQTCSGSYLVSYPKCTGGGGGSFHVGKAAGVRSCILIST
jgi:hypothetical protein